MCAQEAGRWGSCGLAGLDGLQRAHLTGLGKAAFPEQPVGDQKHGRLCASTALRWRVAGRPSVLRVRGLGSRGYGVRLAVEGPWQDFASKHLASQTVLHTDGAQAYSAPVPNLELRHDTVSHSTKKGGPFFVKNCTHKGVPPTA